MVIIFAYPSHLYIRTKIGIWMTQNQNWLGFLYVSYIPSLKSLKLDINLKVCENFNNQILDIGMDKPYMKKRWQSNIDRALDEAMQNGDLQNLPGAGKPLDLSEDSNVPSDMRLAYKILKRNNMAPEWIEINKTLEKKLGELHKKIKQLLNDHLRILGQAEIAPEHQKTAFRQNARDFYEAGQRKLQRLVEQYNRMVSDYNLKAPRSVTHRLYLTLEREIERVQKAD